MNSKRNFQCYHFQYFKHLYLELIQADKAKDARKFYIKFKDLFSKNPEKTKIIDTLETVSKENLSSKLYSDLLEKRDRVPISNYSTQIYAYMYY